MLLSDLRVDLRIGIGQRPRRRRVHLIDPLRALRCFLRREWLLTALPCATLKFFLDDFFVVRVRTLSLQPRVDAIRKPVAVVLHFLRLRFALRRTLVPPLVLAQRPALFARHRLAELLDESAHRPGIRALLRRFLVRRHVPRHVRRHREQVARRLDHDPPVRLAEPLQMETVAPMPGKRFPLLKQLHQLVHRHLRHLHFTRRRAIADRTGLSRRKTVDVIRRQWFFHRHRVHKLQAPPREITPRVAREIKFHRLCATLKPNAPRHAVARAIVDFTPDYALVDAPCHGAEM